MLDNGLFKFGDRESQSLTTRLSSAGKLIEISDSGHVLADGDLHLTAVK
jgi:hypothetical protein